MEIRTFAYSGYDVCNSLIMHIHADEQLYWSLLLQIPKKLKNIASLQVPNLRTERPPEVSEIQYDVYPNELEGHESVLISKE